ncbi:hypothetical protein LINPERPRIM_LOCUS43530 [Linum perenne]
MASSKLCFSIALMITMISFSTMETGMAARNLLQLPNIPNLPSGVLPPLPSTIPTFPKVSLPPLPSNLPSFPTIPGVSIPGLTPPAPGK